MNDGYIKSLQMLNVDPEAALEVSNEPRYKLLISEVNIDNPGPNSKVFIELEAIRRPHQGDPDASDLEGFVLLIIDGQPLEIVTSVQLGKLIRKNSKQFLVLGTKDVGAIDIDLNSDDVESIYGRTTTLPDGDETPFAFAILYSGLESVLLDVTLEKENGRYNSIKLAADQRLQDTIRNNLVDFVVVARKAPMNYCKFFGSLKPATLVNPKYKVLLRDWDGPSASSSQDLSLSRCCGDQRPNDQDCFRPSVPSAGRENSCNYRRPFYLERVIESLTKDAETEDSNEHPGECRADYPHVPASRYGLINDHTYAAALESALQGELRCSSHTTSETVDAGQDHGIEEMEVDEEGPALTVPLFNFDVSRFEYCKQFLTRDDKINVPAVTSWLEMIRDVGKCRFKCYVCSLFLERGFRPDFKHRTQLMTTGYYSRNKSRNKAAILDHIKPENAEQFEVHQQAVSYFNALQRAKTAD